jgi:hypothetical protein
MSVIMGRERKAHLEQMTQLRSARDADILAKNQELERNNKAHDEEIAELRNDILGLRGDIRELRAEMEIERVARRVAEEEAHRLRMLGGLST